MNKMIEKAAEFIRGIDGKVAIIYDNDGDGIGAASIISKAFKNIFGKYPKAEAKTNDPFFINQNTFQAIKDFGFIITVDISFDEKPSYILKLAKKSKILIIDHHQIHENLNKYKNIAHVNPELWKTKFPSYGYCVSKIAYDALSEITNTENLDWLAGMGIVNDKCEIFWKTFLDDIYRKYKITSKELRLVNDIVNSGYYHSGLKGVQTAYKACLEASSPSDITKARTPSSEKLKRFYNSIEREIATVIKNWKKNAEIIENKKLIILKLHTKSSINSPISTKISEEKPHYTVVVMREKDGMIFTSLRHQDKKVNCGELAGNATKNLENAKGGGHVPAAGASIMSKDWKVFKKRLVASL